jgi:hypothetical protein
MKVELLTANEPTPNNIIYDEACLNTIMDQFHARDYISYVTVDTPSVNSPHINDIAAEVTDMFIEDNMLYAEITPIQNTPKRLGELLTELKDHVSYGISTLAVKKSHAVEHKTLKFNSINAFLK